MRLRSLLAAALVPLAPALARACPFCSAQGTSVLGEVAQSDFVVVGTPVKAERNANGEGTTELVIDTVVKPHPYLTGRPKLTIPRYIQAGPKAGQFIVFCQVYTRPNDLAAASVASSLGIGAAGAVGVDAVRGDPVAPGSKLVDYLKGAVAVRSKDVSARLRYFFDYLDSADLLIGTDALNEFAAAEYPDVRKAAPHLPADKLRRWLNDPGLLTSRVGLYALLLAHAGTADDAKLLRKLLDAPDARLASGRDGLLAGYAILDPKAGHDYLMAQIAAPDAEFQQLYKALDALKFFRDYRPDVLTPAQSLAGVKALVAKPDVSDLAMEALRKWGAWDQTDFVLSFADKPEHMRHAIVKRTILRFALTAPVEKKAAKEYVERVRREDPERVKYVEQALLDEQPAPKPSDPATASAKKRGAATP